MLPQDGRAEECDPTRHKKDQKDSLLAESEESDDRHCGSVEEGRLEILAVAGSGRVGDEKVAAVHVDRVCRGKEPHGEVD